MEMNLILAYVGVLIMTGFSFAISVIGCALCGQTVLGSMKKNPDAFGSYVALGAIPTSQGMYGFVGYFMVQPLLVTGITAFQAWAIVLLGVLMAFANFFSGWRQSKMCAQGIKDIGDGHDVFAVTLVLAVFPELYAILGLLVTILVAGSI
jgi:V/A-type H+-transporting ATPase subunit K